MLLTFCGAAGDGAKLTSVCESSSNGHSQTGTAAESKSSNSFIALESVPIMNGHTVCMASNDMCGIQQSKKTKLRRPLSERYGRRLIVKGFAFDQKCKKIRTAASSVVTDEVDGYSAKDIVSSEMDMSPNKVFQESHGFGALNDIGTGVVRRHDLPQGTHADGSLFTNENMSVTVNCDQQKAYQYDSHDRVRVTKAEYMIEGCSVDTNAANARMRGRPPKTPVAGKSPSDKLLMRNCGSDGGREKCTVVRRRGRRRKIPLACASASAEDVIVNGGVSITGKCQLQENWNVDAETVRRRGRPRKIPVGDTVDDSVLQEAKCICREEYQDDGGNLEYTRTGRLVKADEVVRSYFGADATIRKRDRPQKRRADSTSMNGLNESFKRKCNRLELDQGDGDIEAEITGGCKTEFDGSAIDDKFGSHVEKSVSFRKADGSQKTVRLKTENVWNAVDGRSGILAVTTSPRKPVLECTTGSSDGSVTDVLYNQSSAMGTSENETAAEFKSSESFIDLHSVPIMHGHAVCMASDGVHHIQPSKKAKPLSERYGRRLIVKGLAFNQKCKKIRTTASSVVTDEVDGHGAKDVVSSEMVMSPNNVFQESAGIGASDDTGTGVYRQL